MQAPPLAASASPAWTAILPAPARLCCSRRAAALRLESKAAWRPPARGPRMPAKGAVVLASEVVGPSPLLDARNEQDLILHIRKEVEKGKLPADVAANLEELYYNYKNAVLQSRDPNTHEIVLSNMVALFDCVLLDVENPFTFPPYHRAVREPFDYYMFGQNYIRPLVDYRNSYVGNISIFQDMEQKLRQGHNVVLMSNHQTEADPAIIALLLERSNPWISENIVYVAGDRVVTDPLCKPFSMGRNLICVYSKKHMNDFPELIDMKRRANTRSLKEMALLLRGGSQIIWIAPSGGRDRPDPLTGEWHPAPFDASAVDNMRRLLEHSGVPGHIYPLSLLCYEVMPPPQKVEKEIGEQRVISFHGVGLSVAEEIKYSDITGHIQDVDECREKFSETLYNLVVDQYNALKSTIFRGHGAASSNSAISLSQPWR
ncbi:glycerol-3-phosphate acyltransferase, chloroplastic [Oryza brachyantha]|nr:glycerol-3-phosphate acyltransferase, chloroplastic [Oryza brachyantha]XP_040384170.1 glycerol-3-phosphate acyltransferase, chloroplastic [Oryza brachyantha]